MKFIINSTYFYEALSNLSRVVLTKPVQQILSSIKILAHSEGLTLIVCNHDLFLKEELKIGPAGNLIMIEHGSFVAPARYLAEMIKKIPGEITVQTSSNNKQLVLMTEELRIQLSGFNNEQFPQLPEMKNSNSLQIPAIHLREIVRKTAFAASIKDTRQVLNGVLISFLDNKIQCTATNSHRLAMSEIKMETSISGSFIIPLFSIREIVRLFKESETVSIHVSDNYLVFESEYVSLYTRLIEGNYPNLSNIIPSESKTTITVFTRQLLEAIDRASLFTREERHSNVKLELTIRGELRVASYSSNLGNTEETLKIINLTGCPEVLVTLNSNFLIEALKSISGEEITMSFSGSMKPVIIKPNSNERHFHLISPVRG
ncbi:DNA polymerase III subunit beta [Mesobacillus jeotgali]|uniref:DNA polymerase III subunit beta n=1 Tax=Mesobacillus jeotgali TaxID=129985 RepID=UPI0009A5BBA5|nr:DNA polymerase III subunit beta [Mesobacillus jeotgali]